MKTALKIFFAVFFSFYMAQAQKLQSHVLELQNRIEAQIDRNLTNLISTQLAPETFDVSTRVKITEVPPPAPKPNKKKDPSQIPAGMELGSVDVREVIQAYQDEIDELKAFKETSKEEKPEPKFNVNRVEVVVGLSDIYDDAYVASFQEWLSKRVKLDYGTNAIATVNKAKPAPVKPLDMGPTWRDFIPAVTYALLALGLIVAAWLLSRGLTRLGEGAKSIVIEHKNPFNLDHTQKIEAKNQDEHSGEAELGGGGSGAGDESAENGLQELNSDDLQAGEQLIGKITYLCLELGKGVNDLVRVWLDNGNEGFLKTAVLVDMIVALKEKVSAETTVANTGIKQKYSTETASAITTLKIPLDQDLASSYGVNLSEAYREAAQMRDDAKMEYLEKIYWDLLQIKTLGVQNMRKPFDYLQSMNDMAYAEALNAQTDDAKALALMFGDQSKAKVFMSSLDAYQKEKLVQNMIAMSQVSKKQIWDVDSAIKLKLINSSMNPSENLVNLFPRTIDMLNSLSPVDEINVLRNIVSTLPDKGVTIKQQYTTLAFINEWHEEYIARLVKVATSTELVQLIHLVPECKDMVLNVCPDKMKMIIADDLELKKPDENEISKGIKQLRQKWKNICASENIAMGNVINLDSNVEWIKNAG